MARLHPHPKRTTRAHPLVEAVAPPAPKAVLLVEGSDGFRLTTKWFLSSLGYMVDAARNAEEGLALFDPKTHDVILTDNLMPGMSGLEMAHIIKMRSPATPVVLYTGLPPENASCVDLVVQKPAHLLALIKAIETVLPGGAGAGRGPMAKEPQRPISSGSCRRNSPRVPPA